MRKLEQVIEKVTTVEEVKRARPEWQVFRLRLGELMRQGGVNNREMGVIAGAAESTVHHWLTSGRIPKERFLRKIEAHFGKPPGWLLGDVEIKRVQERAAWEKGVMPPEVEAGVGKSVIVEPVGRESKRESPVRRIPVLQVEVGAGMGRHNGDEYVQDYFEVPEGLVPWKGDLSIVGVYGDSMEPTYRHGDLVIVQPESRVMDAVMVVAWDDALMVKRLRRVGVKTIELISDNECYRPITLAVNEIRVVGRVMGLIRWNA